MPSDGRGRKLPSAVKDAKGCYLKNPQRRNPKEPVASGDIGNPPMSMSKEEKKTWKRIVKETAPGVLQSSDRLLFELLVTLATRLRLKEPMKVGELAQLISLGARFGMSPTDRQKVSADKPKESSLATFMARRTHTPSPTLALEDGKVN